MSNMTLFEFFKYYEEYMFLNKNYLTSVYFAAIYYEIDVYALHNEFEIHIEEISKYLIEKYETFLTPTQIRNLINKDVKNYDKNFDLRLLIGF